LVGEPNQVIPEAKEQFPRWSKQRHSGGTFLFLAPTTATVPTTSPTVKLTAESKFCNQSCKSATVSIPENCTEKIREHFKSTSRNRIMYDKINKDRKVVICLPERLDPKVDVVFKQIFGAEKNKAILISFLNAVLDWTGDHRIVDVEILNPYLEQEYVNDSYGILDIKVQLDSGEMVDVEMQIGDRADMERRSTFYICRMFGDQKIIKGKYKDLKRAIAINILNFVRIKDSQCYHTRFRLLEMEEGIELTDAIEIHFIELPKLKEGMANHRSPLDRWAMQNWGHSCAQVCPLSLRRMG
jgi:hypothetical protein